MLETMFSSPATVCREAHGRRNNGSLFSITQHPFLVRKMPLPREWPKVLSNGPTLQKCLLPLRIESLLGHALLCSTRKPVPS